MVNTILGKKVGMMRIFMEDGRLMPVTVVEAGPCVVVQRKTRATDGYDAVQIGFGDKAENRCTRPVRGHFAKQGVTPKRYLREVRVAADDASKAGDEVRVEMFAAGERVDVVGTSKGKGYAGVQKRHHMAGGPGTHGSNFHRRPGSIGSSADPSETQKGMRMAGHMGTDRVTTLYLKVIRVDSARNLILLHGAVPGPNGGLVEVRKTKKGQQQKS